MHLFRSLAGLCILAVPFFLAGQTPVPNASFETWTSFGSYSNPEFWDTPNEELMAIPFFGTTVVTRSTDHHGPGNYSARLETKHILLPPIDAPGFITLGNLTLDISNMTYTLEGGAPVYDQPTHLKGFYKYLPKGGDSCLVGIGFYKTTNGVRDSVAYGQFSTKDTVPDWSYFSIWIDYDTLVTPDTMNIIAFSTAQEVIPVPGSVFFIDDLYLDYTVGREERDPSEGIMTYYDRETGRFLVFFDLPAPEECRVDLYDLSGKQVAGDHPGRLAKGKSVISLSGLPAGVYLLAVTHDGMTYTRRYFITNQHP